VSLPYRCYVVVSREQIALNYRNVRSVVGPQVEVAGVVKADAYATARSRFRACWWPKAQTGWRFSSVEEGVNLRRGGILQARILVMGGFLPYEGEALVEHQLAPVVHSLHQLRLLDQCGRASGKPFLII